MLLTAAMLASLQSGSGEHQWLTYFTARNRSTGDAEKMGLWTGAHDRSFTIDGAARSYSGAGGLVGIGDLTFNEGLDVPVLATSLAVGSVEAETLIRGYEPRNAEFDLHLAIFEGSNLIDTVRVFRGKIDRAPIKRGAKGATIYATCELEVVGDARRGTRTLPVKKSDASQRLRNSADNGRRYSNVTTTPVWGGDAGENYWVKP